MLVHNHTRRHEHKKFSVYSRRIQPVWSTDLSGALTCNILWILLVPRTGSRLVFRLRENLFESERDKNLDDLGDFSLLLLRQKVAKPAPPPPSPKKPVVTPDKTTTKPGTSLVERLSRWKKDPPSAKQIAQHLAKQNAKHAELDKRLVELAKDKWVKYLRRSHTMRRAIRRMGGNVDHSYPTRSCTHFIFKHACKNRELRLLQSLVYVKKKCAGRDGY